MFRAVPTSVSTHIAHLAHPSPMLSHARIMFRKLRGSSSRSSYRSEPAPSAPATTAESETVDPSPRAIHISDVKESPTKLPRKSGSDLQSICILVVNAKGAADYLHLYRVRTQRKIIRVPPRPSSPRAVHQLLQREMKHYDEFDPTSDFDTDYFCDSYLYNVRFIPPSAPGYGLAHYCHMQHVCLVLTYDASSRESWDEMVAVCERIRSRCEDGALPFLATMIAAMGEGEGEGEAPVSPAKAEAFATQRSCLFIKVSPATGRRICDAVGSLVELAHGARDQYTMDQEGHAQRYKRAEAFVALFAS